MLLNCRVGLLRVPWTSRRSNKSILKEITPEYSLEGLMLRLKLQYIGHLMWRASSLKKTLMLWMIEGRRRRGGDGWMASLTRWMWVWASSGSWWWAGKPGLLQSIGSQRVGHVWATELNWECDKWSKIIVWLWMDRYPGSSENDQWKLEWGTIWAEVWSLRSHIWKELGK